MNKQSEDISEANADFLQTEELVKAESENETEHKSAIKDELDDFIYVIPRKRRKRKHHSSRKKRNRVPKIIITVLCVLIAIVLAAIAAVTVLINVGKGELVGDTDNVVIEIPDKVDNSDNGKYIIYNGEKYKYNENITTILFMGIDKRGFDENNELIGANGDADALILMAYDTKTGKSNLISISRETMAYMNVYSSDGAFVGTKKQQLCLAFAYGDGKETSCENQVDAVQKLFYNVPINSYIALDLDGIAYMNDAVGGVTVEALETFKNFTEGEVVTLYGDNAETYVRYRDITQVDSNNNRMKRQKQYLNAFFNQLVTQTKSNVTTVVDLYNAASPYVVTNVGVGKVVYLANSVLQGSFSDFDMQNVPGTVTMGEKYAEFNIDEDAFFELFLEIYYDKVS